MKEITMLYQLLKLMKTFKKTEDSSMQQLASKYKLTGPQLELLWLSYFSNGSTVTELSQLGLWHISTTMHLIKELEKEELLEKRRLISDKRTSEIYITERGKEIIENMIVSLDAREHPVIKAALKTANELNMEVEDFLRFGLHLAKHLYGESHQSWIDKNTKYLEEAYQQLTKPNSNG